MKKLLEFWLLLLDEQPVLVLSALCGLFIAGTVIAYQSEIEAFPELTNVQVQVISQYSGKASEEVEHQVTIPLEIATTGLPGLINQRSISIFGLSVITLTFDDNVIGRQARLDVEQRLHDADIPDGVKPALSPDSTPVGEIYRFILKGNRSPAELRLIEDWTVEKALKSIPGVADVVSFGGPQQTVDVKLDPSKLKLLGLNFDIVAQNISQNHVNAGGGMLTHGEENYLVRSIGLIEKAKALESAVIMTSKNTPIHIRDIGKVEMGNKLRLGQVGHNLEDDVIEGIVLLRQGGDTVGTCEKIRDKIKFLNEQIFPKDVSLQSIYDRTDLIQRSGKTVFHNIFFGIFLVCIF